MSFAIHFVVIIFLFIALVRKPVKKHKTVYTNTQTKKLVFYTENIKIMETIAVILAINAQTLADKV
jgi:hypothetical protein